MTMQRGKWDLILQANTGHFESSALCRKNRRKFFVKNGKSTATIRLFSVEVMVSAVSIPESGPQPGHGPG